MLAWHSASECLTRLTITNTKVTLLACFQRTSITIASCVLEMFHVDLFLLNPLPKAQNLILELRVGIVVVF